MSAVALLDYLYQCFNETTEKAMPKYHVGRKIPKPSRNKELTKSYKDKERPITDGDVENHHRTD